MSNTQVNWKKRCFWIAHLMFQQMVAIVIFNILWLVYEHFDLSGLSAWHIILCVLGYAFFMAEAIALFSNDSLVTLGLNRVLKGQIHKVLMFLGTICLSIGISFKIYQKRERSSHFNSTHGVLGLVSWVLTLVAVLIGILVVNAKHFKSLIRPVYIKNFHNLLGMSAYVVGIACIGFGLDKIRFYSSDATILATIIIMGISTAYSILGAIQSAFNQIKSIFSR